MIKRLAIFGCLLFMLCEAGFTTFQGKTIEGVNPIKLRYAVITRDDTIFGSNTPYLRFDFTLKGNPPFNSDTDPETDMVVFHHQNLKIIGTEEDSNISPHQWCCKDSNQCKLDRVFIKDEGKLNWTSIGSYKVDNSRTIMYWSNFSNYGYSASQQIQVLDKVEFSKTGIWYLILVHCSDNDTNNVEIVGSFEWCNPYGYLSGALLPKLPMYVSLAVAFFSLLLVWIIFIIVYREDLMGLQHVVTLATLVAFSENVLWSFDYISYNSNGQISDLVNIIGALLTAGKLTVIRTCILLVALGYSITLPTLSRRTTALVIILTLVYGIDAALQEYIWVIRSMGLEFPFLLELIVGAVLVATNLIYVLWVGYSLWNQHKTLGQLKQTQKLDMYKKFIGFLVVFLTFSVLLFFIQTGLTVLNRRDELWQLWWIFDAYWEFGYFFVVLLIAVLWWPNPNNKRYACSVQVDGEEMGDLGGDIGLPDDESDDGNTKLEVQEDDDRDIKTGYSKNDGDSDSDAL